jgi:hypothetical protein
MRDCHGQAAFSIGSGQDAIALFLERQLRHMAKVGIVVDKK